MARSRCIAQRFFRSPDVAALSDLGKLVFAGMFTLADDHGRGHGTPESLRLDLSILSHHSVEEFEAALDEIAGRGLATFYEVDGAKYYHVQKFDQYQSLRYRARSSIPPPGSDTGIPEDSGKFRKINARREEKRREEKMLALRDSGKFSEIPENSGKEDSGMAGSPDPLAAHLEYFNLEVAPALKCPTVEDLDQGQRGMLADRLREHPDLWTEILAEHKRLAKRIREEAAWLTFDWLIKPANLNKYLRGNYRAKNEQYKAVKP